MPYGICATKPRKGRNVEKTLFKHKDKSRKGAAFDKREGMMRANGRWGWSGSRYGCPKTSPTASSGQQRSPSSAIWAPPRQKPHSWTSRSLGMIPSRCTIGGRPVCQFENWAMTVTSAGQHRRTGREAERRSYPEKPDTTSFASAERSVEAIMFTVAPSASRYSSSSPATSVRPPKSAPRKAATRITNFTLATSRPRLSEGRVPHATRMAPGSWTRNGTASPAGAVWARRSRSIARRA